MKTKTLILWISRVTYILGISFLIAGIVISYITLPVLAQSGDEPPPSNEEATDEPSGEPSEESSGGPAEEPSGELYTDPPGEPGGEPSGEPSEESPLDSGGGPSGEISGEPIGEPIVEPSAEPSGEPSAEPSGEPGEANPMEGTQEPLLEETIEPTMDVVPEPSAEVIITVEPLPEGELPTMELMAASVGDEATSIDPDYDPTEYGLPDPGINDFLNDECEDPSYNCDKEEGSEVANGGTYTYTPNVVVIKAGEIEFIYIPTGPECDSSVGGDPYCVEFLDNQVVITRNECFELTPGNECRPAQEISNIQFWNVTGPTETPGAPTETSVVITETPGAPTLTPDPGTGTPEYKKPTHTPGPDDTEEPETLETMAPPAGDGSQDLVPVTGADLVNRNPVNGYLQKLFTYLGMMFLGMTFVLKGIYRIKVR